MRVHRDTTFISTGSRPASVCGAFAWQNFKRDLNGYRHWNYRYQYGKFCHFKILTFY